MKKAGFGQIWTNFTILLKIVKSLSLASPSFPVNHGIQNFCAKKHRIPRSPEQSV